jgi:small ligand-binding sensory domain FIST
MNPFPRAHATHADWRIALARAAALLEARQQAVGAAPPTLGWVYLTDHYAAHAGALLAALRERWPTAAWVGAVGVGIAGGAIEYFEEPALALMLCSLPREQFRVFSGLLPLGSFAAATALVHADPSTPDVAGLIGEMSQRTATGYLFGGLASSRGGAGSALHIAQGVFDGGLSGVAFGRDVALVSRVTQGCQPVGPARRITRADRNLVLSLDDEPALDLLLQDLQLDGAAPRSALAGLRETLVGLSDPGDDTLGRPGQFGADTRVRHLVGLDPARRGVAVAELVEPGMRLAFCSRNAQAARRDLVRICTEIRDELEPETPSLAMALARHGGGAGEPPSSAPHIAGAIYVSCCGRGGPHFGAPSAELEIVRRSLGDVPLVGFFAAGEIARRHLYGYTGVLTVFAAGA